MGATLKYEKEINFIKACLFQKKVKYPKVSLKYNPKNNPRNESYFIVTTII